MTTIEERLAETASLIRGAKGYGRSLVLLHKTLSRRIRGLKAAIQQAEQARREMERMGQVAEWLPDAHQDEIAARLDGMKQDILKTFTTGDF